MGLLSSPPARIKLDSDLQEAFEQASRLEARIRAHGSLTIGYYETPEKAARAYDIAAEMLHGEFANHNKSKAKVDEAAVRKRVEQFLAKRGAA